MGRARTFAVVGVVLSLVVPVGAAASDEPADDPTRLWQEFPLAPPAEREKPRAPSATLPTRPPHESPAVGAAADGQERPSLVLTVAMLGGLTAILAFALLAARSTTTTKGVHTMSNFIRRFSEGSHGDAPGDELSRIDVTSYTLLGDSKDDATISSAAGSPTFASYDEVGEKIANVLRAAEENAAQLLSSARAEAQSIRDAAEFEAGEARAQYEAEIAERRSESERIRADANRYAEDRRRAADLEANETLAAAETEARKLRQTGEAIRRDLEEKGAARRQELIEASSNMEDRLRDALATCYEVTRNIESLLGEESQELDEELLDEVREVERETV